jgi:hypothetical protein
MKKAICLVMSLIMIFSIAYSVSAAGIVINPGYDATYDEASLDQAIPENPTAKGRCGKDVYWGYYEDTKTLVINGKGEIDLGAWKNQAEYSAYPFEKAVVGEGVTALGSNSFTRCGSLKSITLPQSLEKIEDYVFFSCEKLESIVIPKSVTTLGTQLFYISGVKTVYFVGASLPTTYEKDWNKLDSKNNRCDYQLNYKG